MSPRFFPGYYDQTPQPLHGQNYFLLCNASISGDAHLEWRNGIIPVPFLYSGEISSKSDLSPAVLDDLCGRSLTERVFSIRFDSLNLTHSSGAKLLSEETALVICSGHESDITYTCYSSDSSAKGPAFLVTSSHSSGSQVAVITAPIVIFVVILLVVVVAVGVTVYLRYSRLKAEPPRMCPIDPHSSVTASLIAATLTPYNFETNESSHLEFPRENLQFVKVLGKQFLPCQSAE